VGTGARVLCDASRAQSMGAESSATTRMPSLKRGRVGRSPLASSRPSQESVPRPSSYATLPGPFRHGLATASTSASCPGVAGRGGSSRLVAHCGSAAKVLVADSRTVARVAGKRSRRQPGLTACARTAYDTTGRVRAGSHRTPRTKHCPNISRTQRDIAGDRCRSVAACPTQHVPDPTARGNGRAPENRPWARWNRLSRADSASATGSNKRGKTFGRPFERGTRRAGRGPRHFAIVAGDSGGVWRRRASAARWSRCFRHPRRRARKGRLRHAHQLRLERSALEASGRISAFAVEEASATRAARGGRLADTLAHRARGAQQGRGRSGSARAWSSVGPGLPEPQGSARGIHALEPRNWKDHAYGGGRNRRSRRNEDARGSRIRTRALTFRRRGSLRPRDRLVARHLRHCIEQVVCLLRAAES